MGIVNVTPDSFSDGGRTFEAERAVDHALRLADEGAEWVDVGGESTRPGAAPVSEQEELRRVIPVIEALRSRRPELSVSVDTSKARVAEAAVAAGARMVNDVTGLSDPRMAEVCARAGVEIVVMHMRGDPRTMQMNTRYDDLVGEVCAHLEARAAVAMAAGVAREQIVLDPGVGFAKDWADNPRLIAAVPRLRAIGFRVLIGASKKRFIGELIGVSDPDERVFGSVGAAVAAASLGADVIRVHDVRASREAWTVYAAIRPVGAS
jgi:dihydropteroate synthase